DSVWSGRAIHSGSESAARNPGPPRWHFRTTPSCRAAAGTRDSRARWLCPRRHRPRACCLPPSIRIPLVYRARLRRQRCTRAGLVSSRVYQLACTRGESDAEKHFAVAALRPLTPQQYALSMGLATGDGTFDQANTAETRARRYRDLEGQVGGLLRPDVLDPRT